MDKRLREALNNQQDSYIFPFLWMHGEPHEVLREEVEVMCQCGIREFCVESRIHENFCEDAWWDDFSFLLEEARKREMKVWLLDDKKFPTGYANGALHKEENAHLRKKHMRLTVMDVAGPRKDVALLTNRFDPATENLLSVIAYRRLPGCEDCTGEPLDLTDCIQDGLLFCDIPEGVWRIFFLIQTPLAPGHYQYHMDMLNPESTKLQIEAVYQPHYEHFAEYFGNTFAGFFSDEPCFGNEASYFSWLGLPHQALPWCPDLNKMLAEKLSLPEETIPGLLPGLWWNIGENTAKIRYAFMDVLTKRYQENFSYLLGNWCRAHKVLYVGHVIEDMNAHMRLGVSGGHFFRSMDGQDMAGIDIVLNQYIPGILEMPHAAPIGGNLADPEFFSYALPKLASSHAKIHPGMKGRAMCEIFGAFGWAEGLPMMKELADYMLVSGITHFVPHAYDPKYPDGDCPPYFYYRGHNPQYVLYGTLMRYMQRMSHLLSGGEEIAPVAVYYNAEAEWCGGERQLFQEIGKLLTQAQIDFNFLPFDKLDVCRKETYRALVVPRSEILPQEVLERLQEVAQRGLPVVYCDEFPRRSETSTEIAALLQGTRCLPQEDLLSFLAEISAPVWRFRPTESCRESAKHLRYRHIRREDNHIYFLYNEDCAETLEGTAEMPQDGSYVFYDAYANRLIGQGKGNRIAIRLAPRNGIVLIYTELTPAERESVSPFSCPSDTGKLLSLTADLYRKENPTGEYTLYRQNVSLGNLARELPYFCGLLLYKTSFTVDDPRSYYWLDLGTMGETAQVWLNGQELGTAIHAPFLFPLGSCLREGKNELRVECVTNPAYRERDGLSTYLHLPPTGWLGPVYLR